MEFDALISSGSGGISIATGAVTGALNGIDVIQNGSGDITINPSGSVVGQAGDGVIADQSASGTGNISVNASGSLTGTGTGSIGLLAEILNSANSGNITVTSTGGASGTQYGIEALTQGNGNIGVESAGSVSAGVEYGIYGISYGTGSVSVVTDAGSSISSGSSGITAANRDTAIAGSAGSMITVTANGTINAGPNLTLSNSPSSGISAGYNGVTLPSTPSVANPNVTGNVVVNNNANISGASYGINAYDYGNGNVTVNDGAGTTVSGTQYGIQALNYEVGNISVTTSAGDIVNSQGSGLVVTDFATSNLLTDNSTITVTTNGTINAGQTNNNNNAVSAGIYAGYYGTNGNTPDANLHGTVLVNNYANISGAKGYGIDAYNWGSGDVTLNEGNGTATSVSGGQYGLSANGLGKGTGNVAINVGANATITGTSLFAIQDFSNEVGNVNLTTSAGDVFNSGSIAINVQSQAISDSSSSTVMAVLNGTIHSGALKTSNGSAPVGAVSVGYSPNGSNTVTNAVAGNVVVQSNATIVSGLNAGINAYNYGTGNVTVTTGVSSSITAPGTGIQVNANNGGNDSITNAGTVTGATGIFAGANKTGNIFVENDGQVTATSFSGINVTQNANGAAGSTTITNTGTVVGAANHSAINVNENIAGTVTINNFGTIGSAATSASTQAISENGGTVIINNNGQMDGSIATANTGAFTGTFNNNAGATWQAGYIDDEGTITASGAGSAITILGASSGIDVGNTATGNLTVAAGAALTADFLDIGNLVGSHGTVDITGVGTTVNTTAGQYQNLLVGINGTALLTIADHAVVTTTHMEVAQSAGVTDTVDVNNATLNVGLTLNLGDTGIANATVENSGTINAGYISIANQAGSSGSLTVDGAGSVVTTASGLAIGTASSSGTLTITNGGAVVSNGILNEGTITATGAGSAITLAGTTNANGITVGYANNGSFTLAAGAALTGDFLNVGQLAGSTGTVNITGAGTSLTTTAGQYQNIGVGFDGTASLTIAAQAMVTTTNMDVAVFYDAGVTDTLDVNNATLSVGQGLTIADAGTANATVENGGAINTAFLAIANQAGSIGSLTVTGAGSVVTTSGISFGSALSSATLTVANGGAVDIGTGTSTIANAVHVGSTASLQGAGIINSNLVDDGNLTATGGLLEITGGLSGTGSITIDAGATLELAGSGSETITFVGGNDTLQLDNTLGFTGAIAGVSSTAGNFGITGLGNVTTASGDAIDFTSSGGAAGNPANVTLTPGGNLTGALNGIDVIQNGSGDITINPSGSVVGQAGDGVIADQSASGTGNISVNASGSLTGTGTGSIGLLAEILNSANSGNITVTSTGGASGTQYGIEALTQGNGNIGVELAGSVSAGVEYGIYGISYGTGSVSVVTDAGSSISSGSSGITAANRDTAIAGSAGSMITVTANGTINAGPNLTLSNSPSSGISAGYNGVTLPSTPSVANPNVTGNVVVNNNANISGASYGINAYDYGNGNVTVNDGAGTTVSGTQYGIQALNYEVGNISVTTSAGDIVNSQGSGLVVTDFATSNLLTDNSTITVTTNGTINAGQTNNNNNAVSAGIYAGYYGTNGNTPDANLHGTVLVNNYANISGAKGYGIDAYNWGSGDVTLNEGNGTATSVSGGQYGLSANGLGKGTGNVAINVGANATITGTSLFAIQDFSNEVGNVNLTTSAGDVFNSGSIAINVQSQAISDSSSSTVMAVLNGTIHSGALKTSNGSAPVGAVSVGYSPNGSNTVTNAVAGNVVVQSNATIVSGLNAGINAYNYGTGNVTVTTGVSSSITAPGTGIQVNANNGGNDSITNAGTVTGATGIFAGANKTGNIFVENDGQVTATSFSGINVTQNANGAAGSTTITNTGTVVGAANHSAINVNENIAGTVTINNFGTIGSAATSASTQAISENGGTVIINNNGQMDGSIATANTGAFTGTFNNNAGATWQAGYIDDEGTITASGAGSAITILGASSGIDVGNTATGNLTVAAGAALTADFLDIGNLVGSHGTVDITGVGTTVNTTAGQYQNLLVGINGTALLTIADHAVVTTTHMEVAQSAGVTDTVDVNNATLNVGLTLNLGDTGIANATVENGGTINAGYISIANQAGSSGSLTVDGAGSVVTTASGLAIGTASSSGTLTVTNGGAVDIGADATTVTGAVHVGSLEFLQGAGIINGNLVDDGNVNATGGMLDVVGAVTGSGTFNIVSGAHLEFGSSVSASDNLVFQGATGSLILDHSTNFAGIISGFAGDGMLSGSDQIDLKDINFNSMSEIFDPVQDTLLVTDGTNSTTLHFVGTYSPENFNFARDGSGGTIVYDPPVFNSQLASIGGAHHPVIGALQNVATSFSSETVDVNGDTFAFRFVDASYKSMTDFHATEVSMSGSQPFIAIPATANQIQYEGSGAGVLSMEAHVITSGDIPGTTNPEIYSNHFHLI